MHACKLTHGSPRSLVHPAPLTAPAAPAADVAAALLADPNLPQRLTELVQDLTAGPDLAPEDLAGRLDLVAANLNQVMHTTALLALGIVELLEHSRRWKGGRQ